MRKKNVLNDEDREIGLKVTQLEGKTALSYTCFSKRSTQSTTK